MSYYDAHNSGHGPESGPTGDVSAQWTYSAGGKTRGSPIVANGTVYVGSHNGTLYAINAATGNEHWTFETEGEIQAAAAVGEGTVYFGETNARKNSIYALAPDGSKRWEREFGLGGEITAPPTVVDSTVYLGLGDSRVVALNTADGSVDWSVDTGIDSKEAIHGSLAVVGDTVYVGGANGVYAFAASDGSQQWRFEDSGTDMAPTVVDETVYFVGSKVYALSTADGSKQWQSARDNSGMTGPSVTVANNTLYFSSGDYLYALSAADGRKQWQFETTNSTESAPVVADGTVYVGGFKTVFGLSAADGSKKWQYTAGAKVYTSPAVVDGHVFVADDNGTVHALAAR